MKETGSRLCVDLADDFWAPRLRQLHDVTLPTLLTRFEAHGVVDAFRRLRMENPPARNAEWLGSWVSDSDLYKWIEAAALAGRNDLVDPIAGHIMAAQDGDGYLHTFYGHDHIGRYLDFDLGHELYCMGHLLEAAVSYHEAGGSDALLKTAKRVADHVAATFGPGRNQNVDKHPEMELALCRLAGVTKNRALVDLAAWMIEHTLRRCDLTLETLEPAGHAVRFLYLACGIAEVALATGAARWQDAARRLWHALVTRHSYCTGAIGGRWMGEAVGRPYELDDETSYTESCASVAMAQLARRMWRLTGETACLDQLDVLLFNALPAAVGADGATWCYSNPHAFTPAREQNLWVLPFEYGATMALRWFPPQRHQWFDFMCCPPNLARAFAAVPSWVARVDAATPATLRIDLPIACRVSGNGWDVVVESDWPWAGEAEVTVRQAPSGGQVQVRRPGVGCAPVTSGATRITWPFETGWWSARPELSAMAGKVFLRRGPVVYALDDHDLPGVDLRSVAVDIAASIDDRVPQAIKARVRVDAAMPASLYRPVSTDALGSQLTSVSLQPYHAWRSDMPQLRIWLRRA